MHRIQRPLLSYVESRCCLLLLSRPSVRCRLVLPLSAPMAALEAKDVPGKGRGAFAARQISGGETVLSEQPLLLWPQHSTAAAFCSHCLRAFNSLGELRWSVQVPRCM